MGRRGGRNCWRTTGDLGLEKATRLPGFYSVALKNAELLQYAGPGRWNDPDYILIGSVGNAFHIDEPPRPTSLTTDEQYSYMSLWALMAAPLIFSGDMNHLDEFTLNVLCNAEVIAIDQDSLGKNRAGSFAARQRSSCWRSRWRTGRWRWACSTSGIASAGSR
jgi:alpha-galactosidase